MADSYYQFGKWITNPLPGEEVVISGVSGRLPESNNIHEFRDNLFNKKDMVTDDDRRWKLDHPEIPQRNGKIYNIDKFDTGYFGVHYRQADVMDPMMKKFLETAIEAILDAGINPSELEGSKTGVFVGACYADMEIETLRNITEPQKLGVTGYLRSLIANRLSYFLKLKGPSCILDTACSSSLNALELAFKTLRSGQCDTVIVGGVNLLIHPGITRQFFRLGVLSADGTCKVFDQRADGYVRGETIACIVLQKARVARRIYGEIVYSKVNCDGFKSSGITFPSTKMQNQLMTEVLNESGTDPSELSFVEAHGTGTQVGDPQEVEAIDCAFSKKRNKPLLIGSVKCSVGHTEPSSGLCSLIKVIIAMETGHIPPNIHLTNIKKGMKGLEEGRLKVVTESTELDRDDAIIAINNFGFGGNNCHVLVRRFKKKKTEKVSEENNVPRLICVSGRTVESISVLLDDINQRPGDLEYFGLLHQIFKENVVGHVYRGFTIISKGDSTKTGLKHFRQIQPPLYVFFGKFEHGFKILGHYLMNFECFRTTIKKIDNYLSSENINIANVILESKSELGSNILGAFAVQIGLVEILKLLNIKPVAVYGESLGKIISAYYYETITLEEAAQTIWKMQKSCKVARFEELFSELEILNSKKKIRHIFEKEKDHRGDFLTHENLIKLSKNSTIINVSDRSFNGLMLAENNTIKFLEILGRLYEEGHNLYLHKLYHEVKYPVSRGTPMISPLIKWNYSKNWYTFKFGNFGVSDVTQQEHNVSCALYEEHKYLAGHVIDGRNLIPAAKYLHLVWSTFAQSRKFTSTDLPVVFENCKFVRAITLPKTGAVRLLVSIQKGSGTFEVVEKDSLVVSGRIFAPADIEQHFTKLPPISLNLEDRSDILEQDEIYRELYLRGYNYSGLFKGIAKCNVEGSAGLVRWEQNYTTFIDKMLQLKIIQMDTRLLYVPVGFRKLTIDPLNHLRFTEKQEDLLCPVSAYKECNAIRSGAIEICGIKARSISKRKPTLHPVLEKYVFVPNTTKLVLGESVRVNTQIILENSLETNFKAVEIIDDCTKPDSEILMPLFSKVLNDIPLVIVNLTVSTKNVLNEIPGITIENFVLTQTSGLVLIIGTNLLKRPTLMKQILEALSANGFALTREEFNSIPESVENIEILTEHVTDKEKLILFRQREPLPNDERFVQVDSTRFDWLPDLQKLLHEKSNVVVFSKDEDNSQGTVGLVNCIRREPGKKSVRCFFMMDDGPKFDPQISFYADQNRKHLAINIYKDNRWGTYRHMLLDNLQEVEGEHFYVNNTVKGDLSSLNWFEGTLNRCTKMNKNRALVYPYYSAINFKDIMLASGRVTVDAITRDRIVQECLQGFEFCGKDLSGRRVTGMINNGALSTIVAADTTFLWEIPDKWTLEEGASVAVVYVTVIYAIVWIAKLKRGMSVLIHSATGGIGLAAINVCLYYGCKIFVTVGRQEKKDYLRQHFPQILESQIGNSRDTSFQQMIEVETQGRGVDVVLNSLSEDKLRASVRCLASGGTFLEIGKFDIENDASLNLLLMERNISYHGVMLDRLFVQSDEIKAWLHGKMNEGFRLGYIKPPPRTIFQRSEVKNAYKYMMTGKHIGKVLLQIREEDDENTIAPAKRLFKGIPRFTCKPENTYVIIGGLGGFGLELADWLFLRGAKNLVLVSRVGIQTGFQKQRIRNWRAYGITVQISTKDVTTKQGCLELIEEANKLGFIDGVFNLAVVLKDSLFESQSQDTFRISLAPKAQVTKILDEVTREHCPEMRYFVVFSSVSCGRGNAGQSNYGMANSIMERICEKRKRDGFPALAIQWGAIGDVGLVAKMQKENKELVIGGTLQQKVSSCLEVLDKFLKQDNPIVASMVVAEKNYKSYDSGSAVDAVAYILGIKDIKTVGQHMTFAELGMDSMMGTEMIQILENDFEIYLSAKDVRSLTFAKLIEIEAEKKTNENTDTKMERSGDLLLQYMPPRKVDNSILEKMTSHIKDDEDACTVFIVPGIEGVTEPLVPLAKGIKAHVFCVQYSYDNPEDSIEETAKNILPHIETTLSKNRSFHIIGYSFGTAVATELVCLLEKKGYLGNFIAIDGSPEYLRMAMKQQFSSETDAEFETILLIKILGIMLPIDLLSQNKDKLKSCKDFDERINLAASLIPSDILEKQNLDKQVAIIFQKHFKSIEKYRFGHNKIKSFVHLIKAKFTMVADIDSDYKLSALCEQAVKVSELDGDHATILKRPELVEHINQLLHST